MARCAPASRSGRTIFPAPRSGIKKASTKIWPSRPIGEARLPLGNAVQIAVEDSLAEVTTEKGKASVQREVDWGSDLLFFEAEGAGSRINIPLDVPEKGRYEIVARIAQAPDYGDYYALLDGKPTNLDNREALTSEIPPRVRRFFITTCRRFMSRWIVRWAGWNWRKAATR